MNDNYDLNDQNFLIYAMKAFDKPYCVLSEFEEEIKRIKYIKRLIKRYLKTGEIKERLILNHIIILANVFGVHQSVKMLFFKLSPDEYTVLKTFLIYLNYIPEIIYGVDGENIRTVEIQVDLKVAEILRKI